MNKLIFKVPNKRILSLNGKEFEINKDIASFIANNSKNIQVVYELNKKGLKKNKGLTSFDTSKERMKLCF